MPGPFFSGQPGPLAVQMLNDLYFPVGTSTTNLAIDSTSKSLTTQAGLALASGMPVTLFASEQNFIYGKVTSYNAGTGALTIQPYNVLGSGTYSAWSVLAAGQPGPQGTNGTNAFTLTTADFTQPAVGGSVSASVQGHTWLSVGQTVFVSGGGYYLVSAKPSGTTLTLVNQGTNGNAPVGGTVPTGGLVGPAGVSGTNGVDFGLRFTWDAGTTAADPGAGLVRVNNAAIASATAIYISETDALGGAVATLLATLDDSTHSSVRAYVTLRKAGDPSVWHTLRISAGGTDNGTWDTFPVVYLSGAGSFAAGDSVVLSWSRTGDTGAQGVPGGDTNLYTYSATLTDADPGNGVIRFNSATLSTATQAYIDLLNAGSADVTNWLDTLNTSTSPNKAVLKVARNDSQAANFAFFYITSVVTATGYRKLNLSYIAGAGALNGTGGNTVVTVQRIADRGQDPFTVSTAAFTQPAVGGSVAVSVGNTGWMTAGQPIYVAGGGSYTVASVTNATTVSLTNSGATGNATAGATVATAAAVVPGGIKGADGTGTGDVSGPASAANNNLVLFNGTTGKSVKDSGVALSTDGTLAANSDAKVPTEKAIKAYVDQLLGAQDAMIFKGVVDCSTSPNYPAADRGWTYRVSVAGKIGGAGGLNVEAGDILLCLTDGTASGTQASVGAAWSVAQTNLDGAVIGPASATDSRLAAFDGVSGKLLKDSGVLVSNDPTMAANSAAKVPTEAALRAYVDPALNRLDPVVAALLFGGGGGGEPPSKLNGDWELLATVAGASGVSSITLSGLPTDRKSLAVFFTSVSDASGTSSGLNKMIYMDTGTGSGPGFSYLGVLGMYEGGNNRGGVLIDYLDASNGLAFSTIGPDSYVLSQGLGATARTNGPSTAIGFYEWGGYPLNFGTILVYGRTAK